MHILQHVYYISLSFTVKIVKLVFIDSILDSFQRWLNYKFIENIMKVNISKRVKKKKTEKYSSKFILFRKYE